MSDPQSGKSPVRTGSWALNYEYKTEKKLTGDSGFSASFFPFPCSGEEHLCVWILEMYCFFLHKKHVSNSEYFATAISINISEK